MKNGLNGCRNTVFRQPHQAQSHNKLGREMDQAQLFKRLFAITLDELSAFIRDDEAIGPALFKLDMAARSRHIVNYVQLEDMWQQAENENDDLYELYLKMKLSPMTLASCWKLNDDMNNLTWHLVLPKYDNGQSVKADNFGQYRALGKRLEILDITDIDIERTCAFLDMVYDFPQQTNSPPKFTGV